jgi:hypothetical protein
VSHSTEGAEAFITEFARALSVYRQPSLEGAQAALAEFARSLSVYRQQIPSDQSLLKIVSAISAAFDPQRSQIQDLSRGLETLAQGMAGIGHSLSALATPEWQARLTEALQDRANTTERVEAPVQAAAEALSQTAWAALFRLVVTKVNLSKQQQNFVLAYTIMMLMVAWWALGHRYPLLDDEAQSISAYVGIGAALYWVFKR